MPSSLITGKQSNPILEKSNLMERPESNECTATVSSSGNEEAPAPPVRPAVSPPAPQPCPTCGVPMQVNPANNSSSTSAYIYALGRIEPRFPRLSVEKEYAQATGRAETAGLTDREALQKVVLSEQDLRRCRESAVWSARRIFGTPLQGFERAPFLRQ
jgi:hypothetical protein